MSLKNILLALSIFRCPWTVVQLFIIELLVALNIQELWLDNVLEQSNVYKVSLHTIALRSLNKCGGVYALLFSNISLKNMLRHYV